MKTPCYIESILSEYEFNRNRNIQTQKRMDINMNREMTKEKVVIIGGGVAGLTAGIYARMAGFEAEIYEKNSIPGGECVGWNRKGYHIDNCIGLY